MSQLEIFLQNALDIPHVPEQNQCQTWITAALTHIKNAPSNGEITLRVVTIDESAHLNKTYRQKEGPTNVLSFHYESTQDYFTGDLAICAALVESEALAQNKSVQAHWAHLIIHGTLHLMGYDHENDKEANVMEGLETKILADFGFDDPYAQ